ASPVLSTQGPSSAVLGAWLPHRLGTQYWVLSTRTRPAEARPLLLFPFPPPPVCAIIGASISRCLEETSMAVGVRGLVCLLLAAAPAWGQGKVDFAHEVVPLLKARCAECHTNGKYKGSFSLDTREEILKAKAAVPGKSAASELIK